MRARSKWFVLSGAIGGLVGFVLMEAIEHLVPSEVTRVGYILRNAFYFSGFGLAVGAALGMTEGIVLKRISRMVYGLVLGTVLGTIGGFIGGAVGQFLFGLLPIKQAVQVDVAIAIDSSSSMGRNGLFGQNPGNDPHGERKKAARQLVDLLSDEDRVAIIDFDGYAKVLFHLEKLGASNARAKVNEAINRIDDVGDTNIPAALELSIAELEKNKEPFRPRHLILLTDGEGGDPNYQAEAARSLGIKIHSVGLGSDVNVPLLQSIAFTKNHYYPVSNASDLAKTFRKIYEEEIDMTKRVGTQAADMPNDGLDGLRYLLRILSWAVMGLAIGFGQGVRENTAQDLRACSLGGFIGGMIGGALFDFLVQMIQFGGDLGGLGTADVVVGACIGGSIRLAQQKLVKMNTPESGNKLVPFLPKSTGLVMGVVPSSGIASTNRESPAKRRLVATPRGTRIPLSRFEADFPDRNLAMTKAFQSGFYSVEQIAEHFGVHANTVQRVIDRSRV